MTFDKDTYWKNRSAGTRGQGDYAGTRVITEPDTEHFDTGHHIVRMFRGFVHVNRSMARKRSPDRKGSKPNSRNRKRPSWADRLEQSAIARGIISK